MSPSDASVEDEGIDANETGRPTRADCHTPICRFGGDQCWLVAASRKSNSSRTAFAQFGAFGRVPMRSRAVSDLHIRVLALRSQNVEPIRHGIHVVARGRCVSGPDGEATTERNPACSTTRAVRPRMKKATEEAVAGGKKSIMQDYQLIGSSATRVCKESQRNSLRRLRGER